MTKQAKERYRKLAMELLLQYRNDLNFYESINFDDTVKNDCLIHIEAIEYQHGNIERLKYEIERLKHFAAVFLV